MKKGFTLVELLVVAGITVTLAGLGISTYFNQQRAKVLETTAQEITGYLRYAQQKSMAQEEGSQWGVHFENTGEGQDFYALYTGDVYTAPVETNYLPAGIDFQTPAAGSFIDISYERLTGILSASSYRQIILRNSAGASKNVLSCPQGLITYNADISICSAIVDDSAPIISNVTVSNTSYDSYVDNPFDLSADVNEKQGGILSCEYTVNGSDWYMANLEGSGPIYSCRQTEISAADGAVLSLNMRASSGGGTGTGEAISRTVDAVSPDCTDDKTNNWTNDSPINVVISAEDDASGVALTRYCVDEADSCFPNLSYSAPVSVSCAAGSTCVQYVRYYAQDNVGNSSSPGSQEIRQDRQDPNDGVLSANPGNEQILLSWTAATDAGSGLADADTYKLVYLTDDFPAADCASGSQIYLGTDTSYLHPDLTNGVSYYYRLCAFDAAGNISAGVTDSSTPRLLDNGEICSADGDCSSGYCYVDVDGDRYAPSSGTKRCQVNSLLSGTDCCDSDSRAYPGESTYYTSTNNCGSWDYDCSGGTNQSNCTYDTVSRSGATCNCYWTSTCGASQSTGYQNCTTTEHSLSCGGSAYHYGCTVGCRVMCETGGEQECDTPPCPGSSCSYSRYYYNKNYGLRTCSCK